MAADRSLMILLCAKFFLHFGLRIGQLAWIWALGSELARTDQAIFFAMSMAIPSLPGLFLAERKEFQTKNPLTELRKTHGALLVLFIISLLFAKSSIRSPLILIGLITFECVVLFWAEPFFHRLLSGWAKHSRYSGFSIGMSQSILPLGSVCAGALLATPLGSNLFELLMLGCFFGLMAWGFIYSKQLTIDPIELLESEKNLPTEQNNEADQQIKTLKISDQNNTPTSSLAIWNRTSVILAIINFFTMPILFEIPYLVTGLKNASAQELGLWELSLSLGLIIGSLTPAPRSEDQRRKLASASIVLAGFAFLGIALSPNTFVTKVCLFSLAFFIGINNRSLLSVLYERIPASEQGPFFARFTRNILLASPLGQALFSMLIPIIGIFSCLMIQAFGTILTALAYAHSLRLVPLTSLASKNLDSLQNSMDSPPEESLVTEHSPHA